MPLGSEVGLGPGHTVLDGTQPPERGTAPRPSIFGPCLLWPNGWTDQDVTWYGGICLGPGHVVLDGDPAHPPKGAHHPLSPHVYCGQTVAHLSCCWAPVLNFLNNSIKNEPILTARRDYAIAVADTSPSVGLSVTSLSYFRLLCVNFHLLTNKDYDYHDDLPFYNSLANTNEVIYKVIVT